VGFAYGDFRIHPTRSIHFERVNRRPEAPPDVGGTLRVASVNLHNYMNGDGRGGGFPTPRGATSPYELTRQRDKLVETLALLDADAFALSEVENDGFAVESAIRELADALSRRSPSAPYVVARPDVPSLGVQVIAVGLLYRPAALLPLGPARVLDAHAHAAFDGRRNRPSLAQRFEARATGERFTVVVNHFKSKGSSCTAAGDPDRGDGQGNCNLVRSDAARALVEWLAADPGLAAGPDVLVLGDLNAYPFEDPIRAIQAAGYVDLVRWFVLVRLRRRGRASGPRPGECWPAAPRERSGRLAHQRRRTGRTRLPGGQAARPVRTPSLPILGPRSPPDRTLPRSRRRRADRLAGRLPGLSDGLERRGGEL
jgi:predicted extracellular nuclease